MLRRTLLNLRPYVSLAAADTLSAPALRRSPTDLLRTVQHASPAGSRSFFTSLPHMKSETPGAPSVEDVKGLHREVYEYPNETLLHLAQLGCQDCRRERLAREIMLVDETSWDEAQEKVKEISAENNKGAVFRSFPYATGIMASLTAGFVSYPLVFHYGTVVAFNTACVTMEVPEPADLETALEVGSWAWNWMEPPLGQISFFLLCMQFARNQVQNLGLRPYTSWIVSRRAQRLCSLYPKYSRNILYQFSESQPLFSW